MAKNVILPLLGMVGQHGLGMAVGHGLEHGRFCGWSGHDDGQHDDQHDGDPSHVLSHPNRGPNRASRRSFLRPFRHKPLRSTTHRSAKFKRNLEHKLHLVNKQKRQLKR